MDVNASWLAKRAVKRLRCKQAQAELDHVMFGDKELENVLSFTYLGSNCRRGFKARAIEIRMAMAKQQSGKLMEIWTADEIPIKQKLRLYRAGAVAILTHGNETWALGPRYQATLKGWNTRIRDAWQSLRDGKFQKSAGSLRTIWSKSYVLGG